MFSSAREIILVIGMAVAIDGCSSNEKDENDDESSAKDADDSDTNASNEGESAECTAYLDCVLDVTPSGYGAAAASYGAGGSCWSTGTTEKCNTACEKALAEAAKAYPKSVKCNTLPQAGDNPAAKGVLYYGACLSELAFRDPTKVFNFYTQTKFAPATSGGRLELSIQPLEVAPGPKPPSEVDTSGLVGVPFKDAADVDADGNFLLELGDVTIPGEANPISGSDVLVEGATLQGRFGSGRLCARLGGHVAKPESAVRDLVPSDNICQFAPIKNGDPTPTFSFADFAAAACPVE